MHRSPALAQAPACRPCAQTPLAPDCPASPHRLGSARLSAPVAQLDRALPSEGRGQRFESSRVRQKFIIEFKLLARNAERPCGLSHTAVPQSAEAIFLAGSAGLIRMSCAMIPSDRTHRTTFGARISAGIGKACPTAARRNGQTRRIKSDRMPPTRRNSLPAPASSRDINSTFPTDGCRRIAPCSANRSRKGGRALLGARRDG